MLFLLTAKAFGADPEKLAEFGVTTEFAHNGSLIEDDIEDSSHTRRGKPCLHLLFGTDIALNVGSFLFFLPFLPFHKNKHVPQDRLFRAYETFSQEMINIHVGQGTDIFWHKGKASSISEEQYLQMCAYKTGCLSRLSARLAVALAGGSPEQEKAMGRVAEAVGVAFQIKDDTLSAEGGEFAKKKGYGDDVTEGKRTLIVLHTLKHATAKDRERLLLIINQKTTDEKLITEALDIQKKYGGIEYAKKKAMELVESALNDGLPLIPNPGGRKEFESFVRYLVERDV